MMKRMSTEVEVVPISDLEPDDRNANRHTRQGAELLQKSLRQFGFLEAGVLDANNRVMQSGYYGACRS